MDTFATHTEDRANEKEVQPPSDDIIESVLDKSSLGDTSADGANDTSDSITFWNIDEQPSIIETNTYKESPVSDQDNRCFQVSEKLEDELTKNVHGSDKANTSTPHRRHSGPVDNIGFEFDKYVSKVSDHAKVNAEFLNGLVKESDKRTLTNVSYNSKGNGQNDDEHSDSDLVEIDVNFKAFERGENIHNKEIFKMEKDINEKQKKENNITTFKFTENCVGRQQYIRDSHQNSESSNQDDPWFIGIEDSENIFTKSLILSGITEPQNAESRKRSLEHESPESQAKRVKIDHVNTAGQYDIDKSKVQTDLNHKSDSAEFCPPVAIVFPMESEQDFQKHHQFCTDKTNDIALKPSPEEMKRAWDKLTTEKFQDQHYASDNQSFLACQKVNINDVRKDIDGSEDLIKVPKVEAFSNLDFDIDIQDSKDDFSIDITPTINHLDEYEEVLAGLIADSKAHRESINSQANSALATDHAHSAPREQSANFIPPNVTYSSAMKIENNTPPIRKCPTSNSYLPNIAKDIESMIASNTMKPGITLSDPFQYGLKGQYQQIPGRPHGYGGQLNMLQSFSLHNDSNLLRKMISTPITDDTSVSHSAPDRFISTTSANDGTENKTASDQTAPNIHRMSDNAQTDQSIPKATSTANQIGDKPAIGEQVRARITLHHTGERGHDVPQSKGQSCPSDSDPLNHPNKLAHAMFPTHSQQPLTLNTNHVMDRGVQDVLLQHSFRRKQMSMNQLYGSHRVPSSHVNDLNFPTAYQQRPAIPNSEFSRMIQQGRDPNVLSHMQNTGSGYTNHLPKHGIHTADKQYAGHISNQSVLSAHNSYQRDTPNAFHTAHRMSPKEQIFHQMRDSTPYVQQSLGSNVGHSGLTRPSHVHSLSSRHESHFAHLAAQENPNPNFPRRSFQHSNLNTPRYPGQFPRVPGHANQYFHMPGQSNSNVSMTPAQYGSRQMPVTSLPLDWEVKETNPRMPFMSDYLRQQISGRRQIPTEGKPYMAMNPSMTGSGGDRVIGDTSGNSDVALRNNSQQYSMGMIGQQHNFSVG